MPHEMAVDAATSYTKSSYYDEEALCVFSETGVGHRDGGPEIPYANVCFRDKHIGALHSYPYIFVLNATSGTVICNSRLAAGHAGDSYFRDKFKWLGTALLALGSEYCPESK